MNYKMAGYRRQDAATIPFLSGQTARLMLDLAASDRWWRLSSGWGLTSKRFDGV
jgi:hypothetical protein